MGHVDESLTRSRLWSEIDQRQPTLVNHRVKLLGTSTEFGSSRTTFGPMWKDLEKTSTHFGQLWTGLEAASPDFDRC